MAESHPDIEIVTIQYGAGDQLQSTEIAKSIITANPDLKGMFGTNEGSAIGVVNGVRESGAEGITIIGYDSGAAQKEAIRSGLMAGAITQILSALAMKLSRLHLWPLTVKRWKKQSIPVFSTTMPATSMTRKLQKFCTTKRNQTR